jgi:hypothetical protein
MRESAIEKKVGAHCRNRGLYQRKFSSPSRRGVPDRLICGMGKVLFLELKATGEKPTALQLHEMEILQGHGMKATWVDSYEDAAVLIDEYFVEDLV